MGRGGLTQAVFSPTALRAARRRAGLSQVQLAALAGVFDQTRVSVWERGLERPGVAVVPRLAAALGVPAAELYEAGEHGPSLAVLRLGTGVTAKELARRAGMSETRYRRIENSGGPTQDELGRLAAALGMPAAVVQRALPPPLAALKRPPR